MEKNVFRRYARAVASIHREQRGMTGLETAIILIAFVTVAAVFGYAVLSAGLFSAERGKETVYAGLAQAKANMELAGSVIVTAADDNITVAEIRFSLRNAIAGTPIDMTAPGATAPYKNRCIISLTTATAYYNNIPWTVANIGATDNDSLLESGEQMEITVLVADPATSLSLLGTETTGDYAPLGPNSWFNFQVKPVLGSTMTIQRTLPAGFNRVMDDTQLH